MREFTIRISNPDGKKLNFGRRTLGDVGKEITAVKVALGAIVSARDLPNQEENLDLIDPNGWLDCSTGQELDLKKAATFDKNTQMRLMKFQLDNQLLIISYLFHKFGIQELINSSIYLGHHDRQVRDAIEGIFKRSSRDKIEYDELSDTGRKLVRDNIALEVVSSVVNLFSAELGELREATLAVLHGWTPQTIYGNESYHHLHRRQDPPEGEEDTIVDIIPIALHDQYLTGQLTQKPSAASAEIHSPNVDAAGRNYKNNESDLRIFMEMAPESYKWNLSEAYEYGTILYHFKDKLMPESGAPRTSALYAATMSVLDQLPEVETEITDSYRETQQNVQRALRPDPLTDPDPFMVDNDTIGFFDIATLSDGVPFTFDNLNDWISIKESPETISRLEDKALRKIIRYYSKPDIWYIYQNSFELQQEYFVIGGTEELTPPNPGHNSVLPDNRDTSDRSKYWVLTTRHGLQESNVINEDAIQFYDEIEGFNPTREPLIKFVEYITPVHAMLTFGT